MPSGTRARGSDDAAAALIHRVLVYGDEDEMVTRVAAFASEGVARGEATTVLASPRRLARVRRAVGGDAPVTWAANRLAAMRLGVAFDDARRHLSARAGSGRLRFAADWDLAGRRASERRAFMRWEAAATAFLAGEGATVLCCHDGADADIAADARATHPEAWDGATEAWATAPGYLPPPEHLRGCPAPDPPGGEALPLEEPSDLAPIRRHVVAVGAEAGVDPDALADFQIAVNEVAVNTLWHARAERDARVAMIDGALVCEVRDGGPGLDPLLAHAPPADGGGRGLWIAHQLADVVQVIPAGPGSRVRLEIAVPPASVASPAPGSPS